jgi:hypothetical protein
MPNLVGLRSSANYFLKKKFRTVVRLPHAAATFYPPPHDLRLTKFLPRPKGYSSQMLIKTAHKFHHSLLETVPWSSSVAASSLKGRPCCYMPAPHPNFFSMFFNPSMCLPNLPFNCSRFRVHHRSEGRPHEDLAASIASCLSPGYMRLLLDLHLPTSMSRRNQVLPDPTMSRFVLLTALLVLV